MSKQRKTNWYLIDEVLEVKGRRNAVKYKQVKGKGVISGPFPTRDIARLYAGKRLSRNCVLALYHGDMLKHRLQFLGCSHAWALSIAIRVDKRMTEQEAESWRNMPCRDSKPHVHAGGLSSHLAFIVVSLNRRHVVVLLSS